MTNLFAYVNLINLIEVPRNVTNEYRVIIYIFSSARGDNAADHGRDFGRLFETLASSIKTKHELGFIVDIASFQLA